MFGMSSTRWATQSAPANVVARRSDEEVAVSTGAQELARGLFARHGSALDRWARRRFDDDQLAEEVVQETVLAAWRKYDQYTPERGTERAWIFGIARNTAATRHQRNLRHLRAAPTDPIRDDGSDDADLARLAERSLIAEALQALSDEHRSVVAAAYWEGLSTKEIASQLGIPDGTVKSRLHYALRILRVQLQEREVLS